VRLALASVAALVALGAAAPAHASSPVPWCGTDVAAADRLPDATPAFAVHVAYVRAPGVPDRFAEWAPRIVGDVTAFDAWWRREDPTRAPRFDTFPFPGCSSPLAALDLTSATLPQDAGGIRNAFQTLRMLLASELGFREPEKVYLVYFDGPTGQTGAERVCGQGAPGSGFGLPGLAIVYLDSCGAETSDKLRPVVAVHELVHVLGAVADEAPNACQDGHVCDVANDLLTASLSGNELETHVLDANRDDYYGHGGTWVDIRSSLFLDRLDGDDRTPPSAPGAVRAGDDPSGLTRLSWRASRDDVGPVLYRLYQDGRFLRQTASTSILLTAFEDEVTEYGIRAADAAGRLSPLVTVRFREGIGMVNAAGRLVRDTVRPAPVARVRIRKVGTSVRVTWPAVRDAGGIRGYRLRSAGRTFLVRKPAVLLAAARLRTAVSIAAVDRAGNVGPALTIPLRRLR
jgi:hypothetical protein